MAVARALAMKPALLLADEPTGNLDTQSADAVFELLRTVNREDHTTILFVTHNPLLAERCDRTIDVIDGTIGSRAALKGVVNAADVVDATTMRADIPWWAARKRVARPRLGCWCATSAVGAWCVLCLCTARTRDTEAPIDPWMTILS